VEREASKGGKRQVERGASEKRQLRTARTRNSISVPDSQKIRGTGGSERGPGEWVGA